LTGVFGYASVDVHMQWRTTPEHAKAVAPDPDKDASGVDLMPALTVPGIDPVTGYFHVHFRKA